MIERGKWKEELDWKRSQEQDSYLKDLHLKDRIERFMAFKKRLIEGQIGDGRTWFSGNTKKTPDFCFLINLSHIFLFNQNDIKNPCVCEQT